MSVAVTTEAQRHVESRRPEPPAPMEVIGAIRLGWYLAEVRGRSWFRGPRPATDGLPPGGDDPLPLRPQRTPAESRQQAVGTLIYLSDELRVTGPDTDGTTRTGDDRFAPRLVALLARRDDEQAWPAIAELIHDWDSAIQDQLSARADILACAYLLGRGLAEGYWALAPDDAQPNPDSHPPAADSWPFLFGDERRHELSRMAGRLGGHLNPLTPVAVSGSLQAWGCVAADPAWRGVPTAQSALYEQLRRWYQLLVLGQDPSTLVRPTALLHGRFTTLRLTRAFWPQLLIGAASLAVVAAFVVLLTTHTGGALTQTLLALVGTIGVSTSALVARAKNLTQSLLARLRQSAYSDLVALEVTNVPMHPQDVRNHSTGPRSLTRRSVEHAVTTRTVAEPLLAQG